MEKVLAVFLFEWRRALTRPRIAWWIGVGVCFRRLIITLIRAERRFESSARVLGEQHVRSGSSAGHHARYVPVDRTGPFRPSWNARAGSISPSGRNGANVVLIGKYLAAVTWVLPAALIGATLSRVDRTDG